MLDGDRHVWSSTATTGSSTSCSPPIRSNGGASWPASRRDLRPELERPAARRLDLGRRGRLPIFPGLVRYDEAVEQGAILHALRFTVSRTPTRLRRPRAALRQQPTDPNLPPMGMRVRLKAALRHSRSFPPACQVILTAMKTYGMFVADNGSNWFVSGAPDPRWNDDELGTLAARAGPRLRGHPHGWPRGRLSRRWYGRQPAGPG